MRYKAKKRWGTIAMLVAISLVAIVGVAAIALDGGLLLDSKREVQAAADAAALAAAVDLFDQYGAGGNGLDSGGTASASALATAAANGFHNDGDSDSLTDPTDAGKSIVTVNIPPASGPFTGKAGYAEVIITYYQRRGFSSLFGSNNLPVYARAVGWGSPGNVGLLILDPSISDSCEIDGNVNILNGGQIWVNSTDSGGTQVANTSILSCGGLDLVGGLKNSGSITYTNNGGLVKGVSPKADPLASIPEPTKTGLTTYGSVTITADTTLPAGIYTNIIINASGKPPKGGTVTGPTVTLSPGIFYLDVGGSLQLNAGTLQGTGVMFFDMTGGDNILNVAAGVVNITPPSSGIYRGISFWISRAQTKELHVESTCNLNMPGTWYAQAGEYDIRPDGATTVFNIGNYICDQAEWGQGYSSGGGGQSNGILNINPGTAAPTQRPILVE